MPRNPEKKKAKDIRYRASVKGQLYQKTWRNSEFGKLYHKTYKKSNEYKLQQNQYKKEQRKINIQWRIKDNLRRRLSKVLKKGVGSIEKILGCTPVELKSYLESKWMPGMSWLNYGIKPGHCSIDHIVPLSSIDLTKEEELKKVSHYSNLQPMWHVDNLKKSNK